MAFPSRLHIATKILDGSGKAVPFGSQSVIKIGAGKSVQQAFTPVSLNTESLFLAADTLPKDDPVIPQLINLSN